MWCVKVNQIVKFLGYDVLAEALKFLLSGHGIMQSWSTGAATVEFELKLNH